VSDNSASFTSSKIKDLCQNIEGITNVSRRLKQFDGLTWLTLTPIFYHKYFTPLAV